MWTKICLLLLSISSCLCADRKISSFINPNCNDCTDQIFIYIKAEGPKDIMHQIWDFTRGTPNIIFALTELDTQLNVTWLFQKPVEFDFTKEIIYSFATVLPRIYEYNDLKDVGQLDPKIAREVFETKELYWQLSNYTINDSEARINVFSNWHNGSVILKLNFIPSIDYATELPHLIHTANSSLVDFSLVNVTTRKDYNSSRFALEMTVISTDSANSSMSMNMRRSLDDEHTPGIFEIVEITTPSNKGFIQFRPVSYTEPARDVTTSTLAHISNLGRSEMEAYTTTAALFFRGNVLIQNATVSFGGPSDGFYKKTNYTAWSTTMGYGTPPLEGFSLYVIVVIAIGLGIPVLLLVSGLIFIVVRRRRQTENLSERLLEE